MIGYPPPAKPMAWFHSGVHVLNVPEIEQFSDPARRRHPSRYSPNAISTTPFITVSHGPEYEDTSAAELHSGAREHVPEVPIPPTTTAVALPPPDIAPVRSGVHSCPRDRTCWRAGVGDKPLQGRSHAGILVQEVLQAGKPVPCQFCLRLV
jgi:hypothetical protein